MEKRRDNKNRTLRSGEVQLADGRYRFKYRDVNGEARYVYSTRLDKNDPTPGGCKRDLSLREKERRIQADLFDQIACNGGNIRSKISYRDMFPRKPVCGTIHAPDIRL